MRTFARVDSRLTKAGWFVVANAASVDTTFKRHTPALVIPYFDPLTRELMTHGPGRAFARVRYLSEGRPSFVKATRQRFAQPKGSPVFAYFAATIDWANICSDATQTMVITEGEVKGLCGCAHGIPTIALGGVDSFVNNRAFLPELEAVVWEGRRVILAFDSDVTHKLGVQAAERRLTGELRKRGARIHLARIPMADDGSKQGLDDLIATKGAEFAEEILCSAPEVTEFGVVIDLAPHRLNENLQELDAALAASELLIFQRSGKVVLVSVTTDCEQEEVRRAANAPVIREISVPAAQQLAMKVAKFTRWDGRKKGPVPGECPRDLAVHYLEKADGWGLRSLTGIVEAPTLRPDGTILQTPGFDAASSILYLPSGEFPSISETPIRSDALAALEALRCVVRGFEFASPDAEAVWIAAAMTAVVRKTLRTAPLFAFSAPVMGAGKTLAADLVSIIASGHEPAVMSQGRSPDEDRKRLLSVLMRGDGVIQIDNCELPVEGDALCAILTAPEWQERILGRSETIKVPTNAAFLATGNNLTFRGDMSTRALMCKILPRFERPEERCFSWDARAETSSSRAQLVTAVLTIIRAYIVAGHPSVDCKPFGRFEEWQQWIQKPLLWLGAADPCKTRSIVERNDPERETFGRLVHLWSCVFGEQAIRTKDIGALELALAGAPPEARELYELACELSGGKGRDVFNGVVFGKYLVAKEERLCGGYRLIQGEDRKRKVATWQLCRT